MAVIAPFRGLTYNFEKMGDMSRLVAPPYDVISPHEQEDYYRTHPNNVIRLILGKKKNGDSDWDNRYTRSADFLKRWESEDILIRSRYPSVYLTSHEYDPGDGSGKRTRWGFIALVLIEDEGSGVILPHEKTFSAHKDDRLKLIRACNTQLSQVFGLYDDEENIIMESLKRNGMKKPVVSFGFRDGTNHKIWSIEDSGILKIVTKTMRDKTIFIADGHHRYETSRNYRNIMRTRHGGRRGERAYEYIMMYLSSMNDKGLTILPSHRLIKKHQGFDKDTLLRKIGEWFEIVELPSSKSDLISHRMEFRRILEEKGRQTPSIGFCFQNGDRFYIFLLKTGAMDGMYKDLHPSLKSLDVVILSRLILQGSLGFTKKDLDNEEIFHYNSNMEDSISMVEKGDFEMAFLLNSTRMEQVKDVAKNSLIMPRKSTFFYPKVLSGLVFNKIVHYETIKAY